MAYASVISSSAVIRGNVHGDSSLEILGRVEGDVGVTGDLALGPDAVVVGSVSGARIVISGAVEGDVTATEAVVIGETGRVLGDLSAPRIGMSEGAAVRGNVKTDGVAASGRAAVRSEARAVAAPAAERPAPPTGGEPLGAREHGLCVEARRQEGPPAARDSSAARRCPRSQAHSQAMTAGSGRIRGPHNCSLT